MPTRHRWLWSHIRPRLPALCLVLALTLINSALSTALPYLSKLIIDRGLIGDKLSIEELDRRLDVLAMAKVKPTN